MLIKNKKFKEANILNSLTSIAGKISTIVLASSSLAVIIGFGCLTIFSHSEKIRIPFDTPYAITILIELGDIIFMLLGISYLIILKPLLLIQVLPTRVLSAYQAKKWYTRGSIAIFFLLTQCSFFSIFILYALFSSKNKNNPDYIIELASAIGIILVSFLYVKYIFPKLKIKNERSNWMGIISYNCQVFSVFIITLGLSNSFYNIHTDLDISLFAFHFFIFQNLLISIYSEAFLKRDKIRMIRTFFIIFLFFCMMLIDLEPKATIVNPILNFVNVEWKIPKQFYITKNQTQLLSKSLWYKDDDKNITIPLCVIFDDGLTIYAKTFSGIHVELTKKETNVKHINSDLIKSNGTNNCDKII